MLTPWGEKLDKNNILKEYPRPQFKRDSYINLNGAWVFCVSESETEPEEFPESILVPFSPESELSGAKTMPQKKDFLWYRLLSRLPEGFNRGRVLLHFGAVDQIATVYINGAELYTHVGGFTPFSVDLTEALGGDELSIVLRVSDITDAGYHSRGKQKSKRGGIWYTPQSGIWQTVWMESVPERYIKNLSITPHFDRQAVEILVEGEGEGFITLEGERYSFEGGIATIIPIKEMRPWSPDSPYLYDFTVELGEDKAESYFAMRKFSVEADEKGVKRLFLNNQPLFHNGMLDQGYWSDGLLTAPSDEALIYDIALAKEMGFNMLRKHIKLEPMRWYYHCDRLGMLVWQDMPSGGGKYNFFTISTPLVTKRHFKDSHYGLFARKSAEGRQQYYKELKEMISALYNCPCIALWVPFNEGWGQFDAQKAVEMIESMDSTRTIDHASGWHDQFIGETKSWHVYFKPYRFKPDRLGRAVILTEFGGYNHRVEGHAFSQKDFGYKRYESVNSLSYAFRDLYTKEIGPAWKQGLAAAVYTQLSDVEDELNGLVTYDRKVVKISLATVKSIISVDKE